MTILRNYDLFWIISRRKIRREDTPVKMVHRMPKRAFNNTFSFNSNGLEMGQPMNHVIVDFMLDIGGAIVI